MQIKKCDKKRCGIYCIKNTINGKIYVGKAKDIYNRMMSHRYLLRKKSKDENLHLINAWHKYGEDAFIYEILEEFEFNEEKLREREDYWIVTLDATNRDVGYNMRRDSSTGCLVSEETRQRISIAVTGEKNPNYGNHWTDEQKQAMSDLKKEQYQKGEVSYNKNSPYLGIKARNEKWEQNPQLKKNMKKKTSIKNTEYSFYQYDKNTEELIKIWDSVYDILEEHPEWKRHNIYAACSGEKPSIYGFKWKKVLKEDIVQTDLKESE
jgi:group I intron endonuclease